jgi:hypothetical protein
MAWDLGEILGGLPGEVQIRIFGHFEIPRDSLFSDDKEDEDLKINT